MACTWDSGCNVSILEPHPTADKAQARKGTGPSKHTLVPCPLRASGSPREAGVPKLAIRERVAWRCVGQKQEDSASTLMEEGVCTLGKMR